MIGQKLLDRYELLAEAGRGGMGVVYRGRDPVLDREVAIKMIPPMELGRDTEERFQREARLVAGMDHPAIVPIHDFGRHEGSLFFVMPWVRGTLLRELIQQGALMLDEILDIAIQVAEGLDYSHSRGVIHRDVKPGNVMVSRDAGVLRARVLDFGLARGSTERRLTKTGGLIGSMTNLSPEQISLGRVDERSDLYALGTVLYECLTGEPPFSGAVHSVLFRIVHEQPCKLRDRGFDYDPELEEIVLSCLAKDPEVRPQRGAELAEQLERHRAGLDESLRSRPMSTHERPALRSTQPIPSPMVGRRAEWAELQGRLSAALAGECQLVLVEGEAGTGKTRLLQELESLARMRRIRVLRGRIVDRESAIPYQGLCDLVQDYFRLHETDSQGEGTAGQMSADFSDLAADLVRFFPLLAEIRELRELRGEADVEPETARSSPPDLKDADPTRLYELLARTLARIGGGRPLVMLIENLHLGEVSLAALSYVVRRLGPTPTLIVGTCRRTEVTAGHTLLTMLKSFNDDPRFCSIGLGPLGKADFRRLLEIQLGSAEIRDDLVRRLYDATEGNPYFGQELVRSLLETEGISRDDSGCWALLGDSVLIAEALPSTIQQAVERRVERLPETLRHLLSLASVLGKSFTYRDLENLVEVDGELDIDLDDALDELVSRDLLEEDTKSRDDRLHFASGMVRDILYHDLSRRKRRSLHRRHAYSLEKRYAERLERLYPQLVHHFSVGDVADKTIEYARLLARKSLDAFSPDDAIRALRTALELIDDHERTLDEGELLELLATAYRAAGSTGKALREAERAATSYRQAKSPERAARAALLAAETAWQARQVTSARSWVDLGIELTQGQEAPKILHRLLTLGATVANLGGEHQAARRYLEEAERLAPAELDSAEEEPIAAGGTLRTALPNPISTVDPVALRTIEEFEVAATVFETLLTADAEGNLVPSLCDEWKGSEDGLVFELTLRGDVFFSDGWPLSAEDVKSSFERSIGREGVFEHAAFAALRELVVVDEPKGPHAKAARQRLRFHLREPVPIYPALVTDISTAVVREVVSDGGATHLLGTGPFRVVEATTERVSLERNSNYWRGTPPPLERIELLTSLGAAGIAERLRAGEIDVGRNLRADDLESILRDPRFRSGLVEATQKNVYFLLFNPRGSNTSQAAVRRALAGVVRPQDLVWRTVGRFAQPAVCLIPPGILGHDPGRRQAGLPRDQAVRLLEEAGVERPIRLQAAIHPLFQDHCRPLLDALFGEWATLGVEVVDRTPTMEQYLDFWTEHAPTELDLLIGRWNADFNDPDTFTYGLFHSEHGKLSHFFSSPETDRLLERARRESRSVQRLAFYQRFEEILHEEQVLVPLFHDIDYRVAGAHVRRLRLYSTPPYVSYDRVGKVEEMPAAAPLRRRLADGGEIHVALPARLGTLDPAEGNVSELFEVKSNVFESLTRISESARVVPWLAAFFEVPGGRSYHFRLREKVRFHDGRRLTSRDVRYTFERLLRHEQSEFHFLLLPIRGARALRDGRADDLEGFRILTAEQFVIELDETLSFFPTLLTHPGLAIVPEGSESFAGTWRDGCVGTGPFRLTRFDPADGLDLEKNTDYWRPDYPKISRLVFHYGLDAERTVRDFRAGRLSLVGDLPPKEVERLRRDPKLAPGYAESPRLSTTFLAMNSLSGLFADLDRRRAFVAALDLETLLRGTMGDAVIRAHGLIPPGLLGYEAPRREAAAERGVKSSWRGIELKVALHSIYHGPYAPLWKEIRRALTEIGIRVQVVDESLAEVVRKIRSGSPAGVDLVACRWIADYPDADAFAIGIVHSREGLLAGLVDSPELDERIEKGRRETDPALRHTLYREIEEEVVRQSLLIPLFHEQTYRFSHPTLRGFKLGFSLPEVRYEELYVVR